MRSSKEQWSFPSVRPSKDGMPHHAVQYRFQRSVLKIIALVACAVLVGAGTFAAASYFDINHLIKQNAVHVIAQDESSTSTEPAKPKIVEDLYAGRPVQFLVIGQDTRTGANAQIGGKGEALSGLHNADTTIVVQISADRTFVNLVSIPRDSLVDVPSCRTTRGIIPARKQAIFNSIFAFGYERGGDLASAASCTLHAVNALTGLHLDNFVVADFNGVKNMVDALGGIDLCIPLPLRDGYTGLSLNRGLQHLNGFTATQYARMRHGINVDGSDIARTTRQQYLLKTLAKKALSSNMLTQIPQTYRLARAALSSLSFSTDLANIDVLAGLALSIRHLPPSHIYAQTIPIIPAPNNPNRVVFAPQARTVWNMMKQGLPLTQHLHPATPAPATGAQAAKPAPNAPKTGAKPATPATPAQPAIDPNTGLYRNSRGQLINPDNGGWVNPRDGSIHDPHTGQYLGFADKYIEYTVCGIRH